MHADGLHAWTPRIPFQAYNTCCPAAARAGRSCRPTAAGPAGTGQTATAGTARTCRRDAAAPYSTQPCPRTFSSVDCCHGRSLTVSSSGRSLTMSAARSRGGEERDVSFLRGVCLPLVQGVCLL